MVETLIYDSPPTEEEPSVVPGWSKAGVGSKNNSRTPRAAVATTDPLTEEENAPLITRFVT